MKPQTIQMSRKSDNTISVIMTSYYFSQFSFMWRDTFKTGIFDLTWLWFVRIQATDLWIFEEVVEENVVELEPLRLEDGEDDGELEFLW